jgi:Dolichyl-phosphate-mannose-protein mannosyltransferase
MELHDHPGGGLVTAAAGLLEVWRRPRWAGAPRELVLLLTVLTLGRLLAAAFIPYTEDEAYYRLWAERLQLGYYDHPPMAAWWIRIGQLIAGDNPLGARLLAVLATTLVSLLLYDLARKLGLGERTAVRAAVWYNAVLLVGFGSFMIIPDAPSCLFWTATLWSLVKTKDGEAWWLAAGATAGLALLSKYSALFLGPGVLIWLAATPKGRARLATRWPWLAALIAGSIFALNVGWNATHDWVSFKKQFGRAAPHGLTPQNVLTLIVGQALVFNPLLTPFALRGCGRIVTAWRKLGDHPLALVLAATVPFALYLLIHSFHAGVQAHWPAPLYPGLALIAAWSAEDLAAKPIWRALAKWAAPFGIVATAITLLHLAIPASDFAPKQDLTTSLRGWPAFGREVEALRAHTGAGWIGTLSYGQAAMLDATREVRAPVLQVTERSRYAFADQPPAAAMTQPGLLVDLQRRFSAEELAYCFGEFHDLGVLVRGRADVPRSRYGVYFVAKPRFDLARRGCWEGKNLKDSRSE